MSPKIVEHIETDHRNIKTEIPCEGTEEVMRVLEKYESRAMQGQMPLVWDYAEGHSVYDLSKNKWIDFTSTIFVSNVGHSNQNIINAVKMMLDKPLIHSYAYANNIRAKYQKKLIEFAGKDFDKAFLLSSGTESTEAALKLMRLHSKAIGKRRPGIICFENNWHGRTLGAQMMSSNKAQKEWIGYQDKDIHHIPFPYPWDLKDNTGIDFLNRGIKVLNNKGINLKEDICGFILETFQGWGAIFYPNDFVKGIKNICEKNNILLTFDEMQSGFGRTGKSFGYVHYGVEPDLICVGKGMGGGTPLSGVLGKANILDLPEIGNMSSTHSANPLVCTAGLAVLEEIENRDLLKSTEQKGKILIDGLQNLKNKYPTIVSHVFGKGLIAAILFKNSYSGLPDSNFTSRVAERCMQKGLLVVHTGRESIKVGPPLIISIEALIEGISVLDDSISEIFKEEYN